MIKTGHYWTLVITVFEYSFRKSTAFLGVWAANESGNGLLPYPVHQKSLFPL